MIAHLTTIDDHVDSTVLEQEFGTLETIRQGLAHGLLDDTRTSEADQGTGFGDIHIAQKGEAGGDAAHGGIGQYGDKGQLGFAQLSERGAGLSHLHQGQQTFLHTRTAAGREADEGAFLFECDLHAAHESLTHHGAHRAAHEVEFEYSGNHGYGMDATLQHDERVVFVGALLGGDQTIAIFLLVFELQRIDRQYFGADLELAFAIQQPIQTGTRSDAVMMVALGADAVVLLQIGVIQHGLAGRAFVPQTFRYVLLRIFALAAFDLRRQ